MSALGSLAASVVIPTYNRMAELRQVLEALERQDLPPAQRVEVVVVDDGSSDGTREWLRSRASRAPCRALFQDNSGPARARNRGVEEAKGELILFLGDDTVPQPGWLRSHLEEHRLLGAESAAAVLGYTTFPTDTETSFTRWVNEFGAQFGYSLITTAGEVPFNFFYTSNISLPRRELLRLGGFREDFPAAAWEDIELAYRAVKSGLRIRYQPRARVVHHHPVSPRDYCRRQHTSGLSAAIFAQLHPELEDFLGVNRLPADARGSRLTLLMLEIAVTLGESLPGVVATRHYQRYLDVAYLRGLARGLERAHRS